MSKPNPEHTPETLIAAAQAVAQRLGSERLTVGAFCREAKVEKRHVRAAFGSWRALCAAAGLRPTAWKTRVPDDEIFAAMRNSFAAHGGIVTRTRFERGFRYSPNLITRRFRTWHAALAAFRDWIAAREPDFPWRAELEARIAGTRPAPQAADRPPENASPGGAGRQASGPQASGPQASGPPWPSVGARACGPALAFRAMACAPVNEMGVVLLFGMVAQDLGYAVDAIGAAYPDCAAKRLVAVGRGGGPRAADARWEPVRVEFEYRSRSFFYHAHDPDQCDVIVCWAHDWPDCPLEVLELRAVVAALAAADAQAGRAA